MANTPVTPQVHETLDVHGHLSAKIPFHGHLRDLVTKRVKLAVGEITDTSSPRHANGVAQLLCRGPADPIDVGQRDFRVLVSGILTPAIRAIYGTPRFPGRQPAPEKRRERLAANP